MKNDLDLIIEHLQDEIKSLEVKVEECNQNLDYRGMAWYTDGLWYTKEKLRIFQHFKNPNHNRIFFLEKKLRRLEEECYKPLGQGWYGDEEKIENLKSYFKERARESFNDCKEKLEELRTIKPKNYEDNDQILSFIESLVLKKHKSLEFEILKDEVSLRLKIKDDIGIFKFICKTENAYFYRFQKPVKQKLKRLGFNKNSLKKKINNFSIADKSKILEMLSIIYFEIFEMYGNQVVNIIILSNTKG